MSILIYDGIQSDIRVKSYWPLNLLRASAFKSKRLDILRDSIRHPSKNLLSFELVRASIIYFERLDILRDSVRQPSEKLSSFEFAQSFGIQFRASRHITVLNQTSEQKVLRASVFNFEPLDIL